MDHIAMNGAGAIHDYELARIGATTESVARYIQSGEFGLWKETGELNDWIVEAAASGEGLGEHIGRRIAESDYPYRDLSVFAAAYRNNVPATVHVGIGYDILHEHPNFDGAAAGTASYRDFLIFTKQVENLEGGVLLSFGSAIMAPEVYLKALAMSRNIAHQEGRSIRQVRHRGVRSGAHRAATSIANCRAPIPVTTSARTRPFLSAPSPMAARASICGAPSRHLTGPAKETLQMTDAQSSSELAQPLRPHRRRHLSGPLVPL